MKQVTQNLKSGATELQELPRPNLGAHSLLIQTHVSLISAGTERMLVDFGKANYVQKARQQPEKVKMVLDKIRTDGLLPTIKSIKNKLDTPMTMGYSNVGKVLELGSAVNDFKVGQRVVSNAAHAEVVTAAKNLTAVIPDEVSDDEASFTVVAAIALQGVRITAVELGETVVVIGLGLIGLLTVQLLRAYGCKVIGMDFCLSKLLLAKKFGAEVVDLNAVTDPVAYCTEQTKGYGVDAVIITASTASNEPMHQAANMCRKKGRITLVGVTGLELSRADFYKKELTFRVSCSYGPGRYDEAYEDKGQDYPLGYVRWTAQRNFQTVLSLMAEQKIDVGPLTSHRFVFEQAQQAYDVVSGDTPSIGIILEYTASSEQGAATAKLDLLRDTYNLNQDAALDHQPQVSFIGAGNYATQILAPAFAKQDIHFNAVAGFTGLNCARLAKKFAFTKVTTDVAQVLADEHTDIVVIATQHNSHAKYIIESLNAGKHVFVEKPLCITTEQLEQIEDTIGRLTATSQLPKLMVGFNRRFAPQVVKMQKLLAARPGPKSFIYTVNAGFIPKEHWTQDKQSGGGRLLGEACHFIDLLRFLANSPIEDSSLTIMGEQEDVARIGPDYLPGHAHADTLSFEMSLGPDRLFVNTGTSTYEPGAERLAERATAAHNTVVVNNSNSSQVWSSFRVAGRAYPLDLSIEQQPKEAIISCGHTGYQTLSRDLRHYREWRANANSLQIIDRLTTSAKQIPAVAYYYLHPDIVVTQLAPNLISLATLSGLQALLQLGVGKLSVTDSKYALGFGNKVLAKCLRISLVNNRVEVNITWNN